MGMYSRHNDRPQLLKSQLITIAKEGVAYDDGKLHTSLNRFTVSIRDAEEKPVAGIGVIGASAAIGSGVNEKKPRMSNAVPWKHP
jgi:DNA-binding IclR family transcriptional regulator